jgi:acyl-coenzyme A synthetase/AMP-(fatty) acid ligase
MVPADIDVHAASLPRNSNGKIDRKTLALQYEERRATQA